MNILLVFSIILSLNLTCNIQKLDYDKCNVISTTLAIDEIHELLSLDLINDKKPIRVIDETGNFLACNGLLYNNGTDFTSITFIDSLPYDLNTGHYRDLIISSIDTIKDDLVVDMYMSNYKCIHDVKNKVHATIKFTLENNKVNVKSFRGVHWD